MSEFKALLVSEEQGQFARRVVLRRIDELPAGEVLIRVHWSSLNYKDALSASGNRGVTRHYPHTPGIDRKSTRLNSSHVRISYAVFCWKKKSASATLASSAMGPASATPVGPPPMVTKVRSRRRSAASSVVSASSKARRLRWRSLGWSSR